MNSPKTEVLPAAGQDVLALQAIRDAMFACNAAKAPHLQHQQGTFGRVYHSFIDAATAVFNSDIVAHRLLDALIETGEDATYCLNLLRDEICSSCGTFYDIGHCTDCNTRDGENHVPDCCEIMCLGHETTDGPMGISVYCGGSCRPKQLKAN